MSGVNVRPDLTLAPVNKVHHVHTIARAAEMLEEEVWLSDVANEMDQEDGLIWVYGPGDKGDLPTDPTPHAGIRA